MNRWIVTGRRIDGRAGSWSYIHDMRLVVDHCGHMTALRPYTAAYNGRYLTKVDLCRSMAVVYNWQHTDDYFAEVADQLLAVRNLREMQAITEHWLRTKGATT